MQVSTLGICSSQAHPPRTDDHLQTQTQTHQKIFHRGNHTAILTRGSADADLCSSPGRESWAGVQALTCWLLSGVGCSSLAAAAGVVAHSGVSPYRWPIGGCRPNQLHCLPCQFHSRYDDVQCELYRVSPGFCLIDVSSTSPRRAVLHVRSPCGAALEILRLHFTDGMNERRRRTAPHRAAGVTSDAEKGQRKERNWKK